jgi:Uncharacterized protein conserved in bacteria (DUF2213)
LRAPGTRRYDLDERLHVSCAVLTKACVSGYLGAEVPNWQALGLRADVLYPLLRDPSELAKALDSFNALPVLMRHVAVSITDHRPEDTVGATGTDAAFDGTDLTNSLVLWTAEAISAVETGRQRNLSVGYRFRAGMEAGTFKGERFVGRMVDIAANHLALVGPSVKANVASRSGKEIVNESVNVIIASGRSREIDANAASKSAAERTSTGCNAIPTIFAAASVSFHSKNFDRLLEFHSTAIRDARGTISLRSSTRLLAISEASVLNPVMLPPGRLRLATKPLPTGSAATSMTIGILSVARRAAKIGASPAAIMMSTGMLASSVANAGNRSS